MATNFMRRLLAARAGRIINSGGDLSPPCTPGFRTIQQWRHGIYHVSPVARWTSRTTPLSSAFCIPTRILLYNNNILHGWQRVAARRRSTASHQRCCLDENAVETRPSKLVVGQKRWLCLPRRDSFGQGLSRQAPIDGCSRCWISHVRT